MKKAAVQLNLFFVLTLGGLTVIATAFSSFLYYRNQLYMTDNRRLILQNDSIMSVNIELQKALEHKPNMQAMLSKSDNYTSSNLK